MNLDSFTASNGWLSVFCTKYKISFRNPDVSKKETEELRGAEVAENTNLLGNNDESGSEEHLHNDADTELNSERALSPVTAESPAEVSPKRHRFDNSSKISNKTLGLFPPRILNGATSSAPTVLHSNGMVFVTLANGTNIEIADESVTIHTTSNELVTVNENTTSVHSGTSQLTFKDGVIQIKPIEDDVLQLQ